MDDFKLEAETEFYQGNSLQVYKSSKTGLHVIIANVDGPVVNGFFSLATEDSSDDGLPHTLEHLIFLGSENYPYKGILDLLANRCLAEGTNAATYTDHTYYTIKTAGYEGFLNLLPIYLDHILYPTLTDAGFVTEVYHINREGEDAGVVYSEMQARETSAFSRGYLEMIRILYPEGCGYRYETGGIMANFRESTTIEKIRDFHKEMYRPENLYVIIVGQINPHHVFKVLKPFEEKIISKGSLSPFTQPWQTPVPPFSQSVTKNIVYPSDSEDTGKVVAGWRGPSSVHQLDESIAIEILLEYLTHSSISPLPRAFVETEDPLASEVKNYFLNHSETGAVIYFDGVPYKKISSIEKLLNDTLTQVAEGAPHFDIVAMKSLINNEILEEDNKMESDPHESVAENIMKYTLYGNNANYLEKAVDQRQTLEKLYKEDSAFWISLMKKYLLGKPMVIVNVLPSIKDAEKLKEDVKIRVEERKTLLGENGLIKLQEKLEEAERFNEIAAPDDMLQGVPVASTDGIPFHSLSAYSNLTGSEHPKQSCPFFDVSKVPFKIELDDVKSNFVQLTAKLDLSSLDKNKKLYLPLLSELLLESPIQKGSGPDSVIPHEEVIKQLNADTLFVYIINGLNFSNRKAFSYGNYFSNLAINMKVSIENCQKGIQWLKDILFNVVMDADRVKVKINKLLNSIGEYKRDGYKMVFLLRNQLLFSKDAVVNRGNFLVQEKFLNQLLREMKANPAPVLSSLRDIYKHFTSFNGFSLHLAANLHKVTSSVNLLKLLQDFDLKSPPENSNYNLTVVADKSHVVSIPDGSLMNGYIIGLGSIESSYLYQTTASIDDFNHQDLPAIMVAIEYFTQLEGPFWKRVRGKGLAYHYALLLKPSEGTLTLLIARAAQIAEAYKVTLEILQSYLGGAEEWSRLLYESAKSALLYEIIEREENISGVVQQSLFSYYRKVSSDYNRELVKKISSVSFEEMKSAAYKYFTPILDPSRTTIAVVCQASNESGIQKSLQSVNLKLEIIKNLTDSWVSQL